jgi:lysophospholipase L1-like esterase
LGRVAGSEEVYNAMAMEAVKELNVPVDDLWAKVSENQKTFPPRPLDSQPKAPQKVKARPGEMQEPYNVHFTASGYKELAAQVASSIERVLASMR